MHSTKDKEMLDNRNNKDKLERTTRDSLEKRGVLIDVFEYWYLSKNEFPHSERGNTQLVLRLRDKEAGHKITNRKATNKPNGLSMREFTRIYNKIGLEGFAHNTENNCSVNRFHIHLFN